MSSILINPEIEQAIEAGWPIVLNTSSGKDSAAMAVEVIRLARRQGWKNQMIFCHGDLLDIEWAESLPLCEEHARHFGIELMVVRRPAGGLIERWEQRWQLSVAAYQNLDTVRLRGAWSSPSTPFCTSDLKSHPIHSAVRKRFGPVPYINVLGIRRGESSRRAKRQPSTMKLDLKGRPVMLDWCPILDHSIEDVFRVAAEEGLRPHPAYTEYGSTRVSCTACIQGSLADLTVAARHPPNAPTMLRLINLEILSGFSFQASRWLADVAHHLLDADLKAKAEAAKAKAAKRNALEALLPQSLLFDRKGLPTRLPTEEEAVLLAHVRRSVASLYQFDAMRFAEPVSITGRFAQLLSERNDAPIPLSALPPARATQYELQLASV